MYAFMANFGLFSLLAVQISCKFSMFNLLYLNVKYGNQYIHRRPYCVKQVGAAGGAGR